MNEPQPYDPRRALSAHRAQERAAWDRYAAATVSSIDPDRTYQEVAETCAKQADALLA